MVSNPVKINVICVRINSVPRWAGERSAAAPRIARRSGSTARSPRRASRAPRHSPAPTGSHQRCTRTAARALQVAQHSAGTNARWCFLTAALPLLLLLLLLLVTARQRNPHVCREGARTERSIDYGKAPGPGPPPPHLPRHFPSRSQSAIGALETPQRAMAATITSCAPTQRPGQSSAAHRRPRSACLPGEQ